MKKILFYSGSLRSGGAERQMVNLSILLKAKGYQVSFLCLDSEGEHYKEILLNENIDIAYSIQQRKGNNIIFTLAYLWRLKNELKKYIKTYKYDVVITFLETCNTAASLVRRNTDFLLIAGERSAQVEEFISIKKKVHKRLMMLADYIVCNSLAAKIIWLNHYPQYAERLKVIYNSLITPKPHAEYEVKKTGKLSILVAASIKEIKNPIGLVEAINLLSDQEKDKVEVHWYGNPTSVSTYNDMKSLIEKYNLQKVIFVYPATKKITDRMNVADAVGLFSRVEGLPNAILEGMALSKPILMTRVSDYDILVDDTNGKLCDWDNPESIKEAILFVAGREKHELIEMGKNSKSKIDNLCSNNVIVEQWDKLIQSSIKS